MKEIKGRCLIDTNVLIYATLESDPRFEIAQRVLMQSTRATLFISVQNLAEMYPNLTGPRNKNPDTAEIASLKIESIKTLSNVSVIPVTAGILSLALELCKKYNIARQKYFDMQLVASMLHFQVETIITENDKDFNNIKEIKVWNPF